ncbi:MAG: hypothetical protein V3U53_06025 [bacterium]
MIELSVHLPDLNDIVLALAISLYFLAVCAAVSIPWLAAHLEFWGIQEGYKSYQVAASRLSETAVYNLGAAFLFGLLSFLLASMRTPNKLFTASVLLAPGLGFFLIFLAGYVGLIFLYRHGWKWSGKFHRVHVWIGVSAGVLASFCVAFLVALIIGVSDVSLWPILRIDSWSVFREADFLFGWLFAFLTVFLTGGIVVMLVSRDAFRWESGSSLSEGARLIRLGAFFSLCAIFLMVILSVVWVLFRGLGPFQPVVFSDRPELIPLAVIAFAGMVALVEILMSALKRRGSAPRASIFAAVFLFLAVFGMTSILSWKQGLPKREGGNVSVFSQEKPQLGNAPR